MSDKAFRSALEKRITKFGGQAVYARHLNISRSFISAVYLKQRLPNKAILDDLGYELIKTVKHEYPEKEMTNRDLNPTPAAVIAMSIWGDEYGPQNLGSMGWFDTLSPSRQWLAQKTADRAIQAAIQHGLISEREKHTA